MKMVKQAKKVCQILKDNYLSICALNIDDTIVELEKPIDYLIGNPNQAVRINFLVNKKYTKYVAESFCDIFNYIFSDFRTVITKNITSEDAKYDKVTCLLVF